MKDKISNKALAAAGAAVGSAAIAAALLWVKRKKDADKPAAIPPPSQDVRETD